MAGWAKRFHKPTETVYCPHCGSYAEFEHRYTDDRKVMTLLDVHCYKCSNDGVKGYKPGHYKIVSDGVLAATHGEYVAELIVAEVNPGKGMAKTIRRFPQYTPDYDRTEVRNGEDKRDWFRRVFS